MDDFLGLGSSEIGLGLDLGQPDTTDRSLRLRARSRVEEGDVVGLGLFGDPKDLSDRLTALVAFGEIVGTEATMTSPTTFTTLSDRWRVGIVISGWIEGTRGMMVRIQGGGGE